MAVQAGTGPIVTLLIAAGADPDAPNSRGERAIHQATFHGRHDVVEALCQGGADMNAQRNEDGCTALCLAVVTGRVDVLKVIFAAILKHIAAGD